MSADPAHAALAAPAPRSALEAAHAAHLATAAVFIVVALFLAALAFGPLPARLETALGGRLPRLLARLLASVLIVAAALALRLAVLVGLTLLVPAPAYPTALGAAAAGLGLDLVLFGGALFALRSVLAAAPRRGWLYLSLAATALSAALFLIPPLTLVPRVRGDIPAPPGAGAALLDLARRDGAPVKTLYVYPGENPADVDVETVGPFARLAVSRAALERPTPETYAALAHLLGHAAHHDLWGFVALTSLLAALLFLVLSAAPARLMGRGPEVVRRARFLPLTALLVWGFAPLAVAAFDLFDQEINLRADAHALALTGRPDALCRWLRKDTAPGDPDPALLERVFFYTHPPLGARLERVMAMAEKSGRLNGPFAQVR
jgi:STE24 endopeptidase